MAGKGNAFAALAVACCLYSASQAFVALPGAARSTQLRGTTSSSTEALVPQVAPTGYTSVAAGSVACALVAAAAGLGVAKRSKTARQYTTQVILPSLTWVKSGLSASSLQPGEVRAVQLVGNDVLLGKDEGGKLFGVSNLCPHIGTPLSEGAEIVGDIIVCPLHGSSWSTKSGALIDWCPSPPIIGPVTGFLVEKKDIFVFDVRTGLFGGEIEVQVDTNAKKAYEADYWRGILDAQGKNDGTYY